MRIIYDNGVMESGDTRRTYLAAERTWLAWWRTGIATTATAVAVGAVIPRLIEGTKWPYVVLGAAYAILAVMIFVLAGRRQKEVERAIQEGTSASLPLGVVTILTLVGGVLALGTFATVIVGL